MSLSDHTQPVPSEPAIADPVPAAAHFGHPIPQTGYSQGGHRGTAGQPVEIVPRGILFSLVAIPLGMAASVLIWKLGFIASITSFLIAAVAGWLYVRGAGAAPRKGLLPLLAVILVGVAASFFAIVGADLVEFYNTPDGQSLGYASAVDFVSANLFDGDLLSTYGSDLAMFLLFAALGVFGTVRRLLGARRA
jgi:hypothetical protein